MARGGDVEARLQAVLRPLGGIARFVKQGSVVVVKPNAAFAETPETGGNTTPQVVGAVVRACRQAGAVRVMVTEHCLSSRGVFGTDDDPSGVTQAAKGASAELINTGTDAKLYMPLELDAPGVRTHPINAYLLQADVVVNLPRLKTHPYAGYTMSIKNLMGAMLGPDVFHKDNWRLLPERLACLAHALQPHVSLNIIDATDVVRGWAAGRPGNLKRLDTLIAGADMVSTDAIGMTLFEENPLARWKCAAGDSYLRIAHERGWGIADPQTIKSIEVEL